jgi:hypothetical protein
VVAVGKVCEVCGGCWRVLCPLFLARAVLECSQRFLEDLGLSADSGCCWCGCLVQFGLLTGNCGLLGCSLVGLGLLFNGFGVCLVAVGFLGAVWWTWACCPTDLVAVWWAWACCSTDLVDLLLLYQVLQFMILVVSGVYFGFIMSFSKSFGVCFTGKSYSAWEF